MGLWSGTAKAPPGATEIEDRIGLVLVLAALCLRPDLAGVTSSVRALGLSELSYCGLLHFFHPPSPEPGD